MFVWDEKKRRSNYEKHGFDFIYAYIVYNDPLKSTQLSGRSKEERYADTAFVEGFGFHLTLVYTHRGADIRLIFFRRSSKKERRVYSLSSAKPH